MRRIRTVVEMLKMSMYVTPLYWSNLTPSANIGGGLGLSRSPGHHLNLSVIVV